MIMVMVNLVKTNSSNRRLFFAGFVYLPIYPTLPNPVHTDCVYVSRERHVP